MDYPRNINFHQCKTTSWKKKCEVTQTDISPSFGSIKTSSPKLLVLRWALLSYPARLPFGTVRKYGRISTAFLVKKHSSINTTIKLNGIQVAEPETNANAFNSRWSRCYRICMCRSHQSVAILLGLSSHVLRKNTDRAIVGYRWSDTTPCTVNWCKKARGAWLTSSYCMGFQNFIVSNKIHHFKIKIK